MRVEIISPDKTVYAGDADALKLPGKDGSFGVLNNHAPLIASLSKGAISVKQNGQEQLFEINGGVVEVFKNRVVVLSE